MNFLARKLALIHGVDCFAKKVTLWKRSLLLKLFEKHCASLREVLQRRLQHLAAD